MKKFVTEVANLLDVDVFRDIANSLITEEWLNTDDPAALGRFTDKLLIDVSDYEHLTTVRNSYPRLSNYVKFMKSSQGTWPVHTDNHRKCAINIPIANAEHTATQFYEGGEVVDSVTEEFGGTPGTWYGNDYLTYVTGAKLVFEHTLLVPTIINSTIPHGINNKGIEPRIICSWTYEGTYQEALEDFGV